MSEEVREPCSFYGKITNLQWHLVENGYQACVGGLAPLVSAGTALAFFSTLLLTCELLYHFKNYRSLYFWTLMITTWSLSFHAIGLLLMYIGDYNAWRLHLALLFTGWICMTTGFSMVLYSRLHLLDTTRRWKRPLLAMIIVVALTVQPLVIVFETVPATSSDPIAWIRAWGKWHRVRPFIFLLEDIIISSFYIKAALEHVRSPRPSRSSWLSLRENREVVLLIGLQVIVWMLDLVIIGCALARLFSLVDIITSFVYGMKLKLEFVFLDQLVELSGAGRSPELGITDAVLAPFESETPIQPPKGGRGASELSCSCGANRSRLPGTGPGIAYETDKTRPTTSYQTMC